MNRDHLMGFPHQGMIIEAAERLSRWCLDPKMRQRWVEHGLLGHSWVADEAHYPLGTPKRYYAELERRCGGDERALLASLQPGEQRTSVTLDRMTASDSAGISRIESAHALLQLAGEQLSLKGFGALSLKA